MVLALGPATIVASSKGTKVDWVWEPEVGPVTCARAAAAAAASENRTMALDEASSCAGGGFKLRWRRLQAALEATRCDDRQGRPVVMGLAATNASSCGPAQRSGRFAFQA